MLHCKKKRPQRAPGRPWKGKKGSRRCPQESPGTGREPLRPSESFPGGPQRVPARVPSSPGFSEGAPKFSNSPTEGPKGSLGTQMFSLLHPNDNPNDRISQAEKLRQKRQTSMLFVRPRAATRGRSRISRGKPRAGQTLENVDF